MEPTENQAQTTEPENTQTTPITEPISDVQIKDVTEPYDLDLDLLQPQARKVKLNGKLYDVYPPKVKDIANLARLAGKLQTNDGTDLQAKLDNMVNAFASVMPALKEDGVDLTMEQVTALFGFVNSMVSPADNSALKQMGIEPNTEKKIPQD